MSHIHVCSKEYLDSNFNPRLTGVVATLTTLSVNTKESDLGHLSNLFYILCGHLDEKEKLAWLVVTPYPGVG